jgi:Na+-transporting NADH:ubiquinone oxidoreductase subunit NqrD
MQRERDGILIGSGAGLTLIILLVLQSFIGSGLFSTRTVTVTVTNSDAYEQVSDAYAYHLMVLNARNINAVPGEYESNATVEWRGLSRG